MGCCFTTCHNIKNSSRLCKNITLDLSGIKVHRKRQCNFYLNFEINSKHIHIPNFSLHYLIPPWTVDALFSVAFTSCAALQCMRGFWQKPLYMYGIDYWWDTSVGAVLSGDWKTEIQTKRKKRDRRKERKKNKEKIRKENRFVEERKQERRYKRHLQWPVLLSELGCTG